MQFHRSGNLCMLVEQGLNVKDDDGSPKFPLNDLPNDVLVSVFAALNDPTWVRHNIPCVCKAWNELFHSQDASPLHETLEVDFKKEHERAWQEYMRRVFRPLTKDTARERLSRYPVVHASRVISWAERHAGSVRKLHFKGGDDTADHKDFSPEDAGALLAAVGSSLTHLLFDSSIDEGPFWDAMRSSVVPAGRLRSFDLSGSLPASIEADFGCLGQLAGSLEEVALVARYFDSREAIQSLRYGLPRFPEFVCDLKELRRLKLFGHPRITALPPTISRLKKLRELELWCRLSSLPKELGELSGLTFLDVAENVTLGNAPHDEAFPAELGKLKSLGALDLTRCGLRTVPAFVGELKSLEVIGLTGNTELRTPDALAFLKKNCPRLRRVILRDMGP